MEFVLIVSRLILTATFLVAGLAKLADQNGTRTAIAGFGASSAIARPLAFLVPVAELAVAVLLIPGSTAQWGAFGALALLAAFSAAIAANLLRGKKPDCRCFGQLKPTPIGPSTLVRNCGLGAVAVFAAWQGGLSRPGVIDALAGLTASEQLGLAAAIVLAAAIAWQGWLILGLLAQQGRLLLRLEAAEAALGRNASASPSLPGLPVGNLAPGFALPDLDGRQVTLDQLRAPGRPLLLVFTDPECGSCRELLPEVAAWHADKSSPFSVALITRRGGKYDKGANRPPVLLQAVDEVSRSYLVAGTPSAVIIRTDGIIAAPLVAGADAIRELVANMKGEPCGNPRHDGDGESANRPVLALPRSPELGKVAPTISLPDLAGATVDLAQFRGEEVGIVFWGPHCDFCAQMLDDLKMLEADSGARRLLFVSTGSIEDNQAQGLRSPVLLDRDAKVAKLFGADGTPMAVLIDRDGRIASTMAAGAPAVLTLVQTPAAAVALAVGSFGREP
jgi:peroxiredoxin